MEFKKVELELIKELYPIVGIFEPIYNKEKIIDFKVVYLNDNTKSEMLSNNVFSKTNFKLNKNVIDSLKCNLFKLNDNKLIVDKMEIDNQNYVVHSKKFREKYIICTLYKDVDLLIKQDNSFNYIDYLDNFIEGIFIINQQGNILYANKKATLVYEYTYDEFIKLNIRDLNKNNMNLQIDEYILHGLENGKTFRYNHVKKDGFEFPVEFRAVYLSNVSKDKIVCIIRDISDMEKMSKEVKMFSVSLDIFDDTVFALTSDFKINLWNKGAEKNFGYKSDEIIGSTIEKLIPPGKMEEFKVQMNMIKEGVIILNCETQRMDKNGKIIDVSLSESPLYDYDNNYIGSVGVLRDLTNIKLAEDELKERYKQLLILKEEAESANIAKTQFLANMSHEIRTPIHGIVALIQLLKLTNLDEEQKKYVKMLYESTTLLTKVINDILDISKIESGKIVIYEEPFKLREIINHIYNNLVIEGNAKGLEIGYYLDQTIDNEVIGDPVKLRQILSNIINNAIKFTDQGYISLRVNLISSSKEKLRLEFRIKDTGIGIDESFKDKIFTNFNQGDISTKKRYKGSGLGLAISKQLAILLGGDIEYESKVGEGSTFVFTCDFKRVITKDVENIEEPDEKKYNQQIEDLNGMLNNITEGSITNMEEKNTLNKVQSLNKTILCIDDNFINQEVMESIITRHGYSYLGAYNGNEGMELLKDKKVDLIFMDIQLPDMNGYEVAQMIRNYHDKNKVIPIIAMTAYAMHEDRQKCIDAGMDDYLAKPYEINELYRIFEIYL